MRSLTKFLSAIALSVVASSGSADGQFKLSSLVVPQGVSYRFSQVRLTRDVEITDGTFNRNITEESLSSDSLVDKGNRVSQSANTRSHNDAVVKNAGASAGTSAHAEISLWSLGAGAEAHAEGHTKIEKDVSDVHHADDGLFETNRSETVSNVQHKNADNVVESSRGTHGNYYLVFTMTLKNLDLNDTYTVKAPADGGLRAILEGLGDQLEVPCVSAKSFTLDIGDERVCRFALKIVDEGLLAKLKNLKSLSDVRPKINGSIFPIVSDDTNKNILKEQRRAQLLNPTTEISLSFSKASMMSPWKVKRSYGKDSGRNGQKVTLRDALKAINEYVAAGDAMPEHVFEFDANEALWRVSEREFGKVSKDDGGLVGMNVGESLNGNVKLEKVGKDILDRPISDFPSIAFDEIDPKKIAEMYAGGDQEMKGPFQAMVKVLKNADEDDDIQHLFAYVLTQSPEAKDRELAAELLKKLFQAKNDVIAATWLVQMYFRHPKTCTYKSDLPAYVSFLIKNDKDWVSQNADSDSVAFIQDALIADENVPTLLAFLEDPRFEATTNEFTVLMRIAKSGNVALMDKLLNGVGNKGITKIDRWHFSALTYSIFSSNLEMCRLLVENGADINYEDENAWLPTEYASFDDEQLPILKYMIEEKGAKDGASQYVASQKGARAIVEYFLKERKVDVNGCDARFGTMLLQAAAEGRTDICRYLIAMGAVADKTPAPNWFTPIERAALGGHVETVKYFLGLGRDLKVIHEEVMSKCSQEIRELLANSCAVEDSAIKKCLEQAIKSDNPDQVAEVVQRHPQLKNAVINDAGFTPLLLCARHDSVGCARRLKQLGADMNFTPEGYLTPICFAAKRGSLRVLRYLLEECSLPIGNCAELAVEGKQTKVLDFLLQFAVGGKPILDINKSNYGSKTLLSSAAFHGNNEMCRWLIERGAMLDVKDNKGWTPLWRAVQQDKVETVRFLVENYNLNSDAIEAATIEAASCGTLSTLKYFVETCNVSPKLARKSGSENHGCLLAVAAGAGYLNIVRYLVEEKGVPVDYTPVGRTGIIFDDDFYSALHMALVNGKSEVVEYLRSKGAKKE